MTKYNIITINGLKELLKANHEKIYSPDGQYLTAVNNGMLGGELLYDFKSKKIYGLCLKEIPDLTEENIKHFDGEWARQNIAYHMSGEAMLKIIQDKEKK